MNKTLLEWVLKGYKKSQIMQKLLLTLMLLTPIQWLFPGGASAQLQTDIFDTGEGPLEVNFVGHASLYFSFNGQIIHVDPFGKMGDYSQLPKADLILITHEHGDHLDAVTIEQLTKENTRLVVNEATAKKLNLGKVLKNGEETIAAGLNIKAVPAYNLIHKRDNGEFFHPKGNGNGYVVTFGQMHIYIAGDTENIPEMAELKDIDIAFLPMNLPYTMTPEMVQQAALMFKPKILYPYHYSDTDTRKIVDLLKETPEIEVRIKKM
jgi:L-ascorbate metabolism protein UlaG (beta-lactamase superfamily)